MQTGFIRVLAALTAVTSAAVGGLFFAFSSFVMRGLNRINPIDAITAMRGINAEAQANPPFLLLFFGSAFAALAVGVMAAARLRQPGSGLVLAGAILAITAAVVTVGFNVPLNDYLDSVDPAADPTRVWRSYCDPWTAWNHVRAVCPLVGAALITVGLLRRKPGDAGGTSR